MNKNKTLKNYMSFFILVFSQLILSQHCLADEELSESSHYLDIKALNESGKLSSLESILEKLSTHHINRILEIELKQGQSNHPFIYEIEYINNEGIVLEVEVDAQTAEILSIEREN